MKKVTEEREKLPVIAEDGADRPKNRKRNKEEDSKQVKASPPSKKTKTANNEMVKGHEKWKAKITLTTQQLLQQTNRQQWLVHFHQLFQNLPPIQHVTLEPSL